MWYILQVDGQNMWQVNWGFNGCVPVPGDYNGDGKSDLAVFNPADGKWYILSLLSGQGGRGQTPAGYSSLSRSLS